MSMRVHYFKTWPKPFEAAAMLVKLHEIRKDDRELRPEVGDIIVLREWCPAIAVAGKIYCPGEYTGRELRRVVTYVTLPGHWGLPKDIYIMSMKPESDL